MSVRVLYDHQIFHFQRYGGISRYFTELIKVYLTSGAIEPLLPFRYSANEYLLKLNGPFTFQRPSFIGEFNFPLKRGLWSVRNRLFPSFDSSKKNEAEVIQRLRSGTFDIYHPTYYDNKYFNYLDGQKVVITIHDLIYELYPKYFDPQEVRDVLKGKRDAINRADHIIVVSESVKKDLITWYHVREQDITVIHHGPPMVPEQRESSDKWAHALPERFILFVGTRTGYKNFEFMLSALQEIIVKDPKLYVICTGHAFTFKERAMIRTLQLQKKILHMSVSDSELYQLFTLASLFIFPSLYEGFGIPVLEAMKYGCPAVLSNRSSLPEVGGDAALYFDPENASSIAAAVQDCLSNSELRLSLIARGKKRADQFSWERAAQQTEDVYHKVLEKKAYRRNEE